MTATLFGDFEEGDVVRLRSGGLDMTVVEERKSGAGVFVRVQYFEKDKLRSAALVKGLIELVRKKGNQ